MERFERLKELKERALQGGGPKAIEKQHSKGKLTARERLELLLDPGSFVELGTLVTTRATEFGMAEKRFPGDGVVTGFGTIDGRLVFVYAQDFTVMGGSLGEMHAMKIARVLELALKAGAPVIGINDSGGARIQEGIDALRGYGDIFRLNTLASGVVPQIALIMGPCAGGAVYSPALMDFVIMVDKTSYMFITGPQVVKAVTGQKVSFEDLGGARVHNTKSGNAHFLASSEEEAFSILRALLSYLPSNSEEEPPVVETGDDPNRMDPELDEIVPDDPKKAYDMREIIERVFDRDTFLEVQAGFGRSVIVGFARLNGRSVGVVANNPKVLAGVLDIDSSDKAARFVRFCDAFNIPVITFVDVPGYLPGVEQEHGGIIRHGAKLLYAYSEATVPLLTVIVRKAYGGAYIAMGSKHLGADVVFAWPTAEIAVMGPEGAAQIIFRKQLREAEDKEALLQKLTQEYRERIANPYVAAERGYVDDIIYPRETRPRLVQALEALRPKREELPPKKHGNIPL
ncbi:MAG: methylmalonyl-CoA carboxyltransferase [Thermoplasmata archaeon]|nr:methylmalonyl-CoA carboxyltransferase [Thermoplasmata archaeon]